MTDPFESRRFLVADVGPCRLGLDAGACLEVVPLPRCARLPWAPGWALGVLYRGGRLYTVVDLARFLEVPRGAAARVAVLLDCGGAPMAFAAASVAVVEGRSSVRISELKLYVPRSEWVLESLSTPSTDFHRLDVEAVVRGVERAF